MNQTRRSHAPEGKTLRRPSNPGHATTHRPGTGFAI